MTEKQRGDKAAPLSLEDRISNLEERFSRLESRMSGFVPADYQEHETDPAGLPFPKISESEDSLLESRIGEFGLAWLGNIVLFFGIIFLAQYMTNLRQPLLAAVIGFASVGGILLLSHVLRNAFTYMSFLFGVFGQLLLYYVTLRLHFFTNNPVIPWMGTGVAALLTVIGIQVFFAFRRSSEFYAALALIMTVATAIISDTTHLMLPVVTLAGAGTLFLFYRFGWHRILIIAIILAYFTLLIWILNNPIVGNPLKGITVHQYSYIYLCAIAGIFSLVGLIPKSGRFPDRVILAAILLNGLLFTALLSLWVAAFFAQDYIWLFLSIALFCLPYSIILKQFSPWKYAPALYVLYGFVAISITVYGLYKFPDAFLLLSIQSLLVVSIAVWYRSKIIVVMNVMLFLIILVTYLVTSASNDLINFSFPLVAFISARIINWQQERLNLKTELIRNLYLLTLFFTMLYALYRAVPGQYVTLSWTLAGVLFFLLSLLLRKIKYRWMALAAFIATAFYLFLVDLANVEILYRIVAFLFLAMISIGISIFYVKKMKRRQNQSR